MIRNVESIVKRDARVSTVPPPAFEDPYSLQVRALRCAIAYDGDIVHGACRDLSSGGVSLRCLQPLAIGAHVEVELTRVFEGGHTSEALPITAEVVWCSQLRSEFQIGAKFVGLSEETHGLVAVFLDFLDGAPATN